MKKIIFVHEKNVHLANKKNAWTITYNATQILLSLMLLASDVVSIYFINLKSL